MDKLARSRAVWMFAGLSFGLGVAPAGCGNGETGTTSAGGSTTSTGTGGTSAGGSTSSAGSGPGGSTGSAGSTGTAGSGTGGTGAGGSTGTAGSGGSSAGGSGTGGSGVGGSTTTAGGSSAGGSGQGGSTSTGTLFCGDGQVDAPEQCDFGAGNGPGTGCESDCTFSCIKAPDSCLDAETCNGVEACVTVNTPDGMGQKCQTGIQALDCTACAGGVCGSGMCKASTCGDGCVDLGKGEQCEPPGTPMCDAMCKTVVIVPCGNGIRDAGEQCDDGNVLNLDGCDSTCQFEQDLRSNVLQMQFGLDAFCGNVNRLGAAFTPIAQGAVQQSIDQSIATGTGGFVAKLLGMPNLVGADDPSLEIGFMRAAPVMGAGYNGAADLDWWYIVNAGSIDGMRNPIDKMPGYILGAVLHGGPGQLTFPLTLIGSASMLLHMTNANLSAPISASFAPTMSAGALPPGHLAAEHLDPTLVSFAGAGQAMVNFYGKLCGDIGVKAFAQVPIDPALLPGGTIACTEGYTAASSLLDVLVGGCTINPGGGPLQVILPTQPDKADPSAPVGGAGAPYTFGVNAQKVVTSCTDVNAATVPLATCMEAAAYSSFFRFAMGRVILK